MCNPRAKTRRSGQERGAALFIMIVAVVVAGALAFALSYVAVGRQQATEARQGMETALYVAEAGLSRGLAEANLKVNRENPKWPPGKDEGGLTLPVSFSQCYSSAGTKWPPAALPPKVENERWSRQGEYHVEFLRGDEDGVDNNGNSVTDEAEESLYVTVVSTGYRGRRSRGNPYRVCVRGQLQKITNEFDISAAVFVDDPNPDLDLGSSASYTIDGRDHDMYSKDALKDADGNYIGLPALAINGPLPGGDYVDVKKKTTDGQLLAGTPNTLEEDPTLSFNFETVIDFARDNVEPNHIVYGSGTNPPGPWGTGPGATSANPPTYEISFHDAGGPGNLVKFSGNTSGAGLWVVDGDLEIGGTFSYTGIIIVTGVVRFVGGGSTKMVTGAVITGDNATLENLSTTGTIDLFFSSQATSEAVNNLARFVPVGYLKVAITEEEEKSAGE